MALLSLVMAFGAVALLVIVAGSARVNHLRHFSSRLKEQRKLRMIAQSALVEGIYAATSNLEEGTHTFSSRIGQVRAIEVAVGKAKKGVGIAVGQFVVAARVETKGGTLIAARRLPYVIRRSFTGVGRRAIQSSEKVQR